MDLNSKAISSSGFTGFNAAASIIAFIFTIVYPLTNYFVLKKYKQKYVDDNEENSDEQRTGTFVWVNKYG